MNHPDDFDNDAYGANLDYNQTLRESLVNLVYHMVAATRGEMTPEKAIARAIEIVAAMESL